MFKIGQKVIWTNIHHDNPSLLVICEGTVTKVGKDTMWLDHKHKAEDQLYASFAYPDTPESRAHLQGLVDHKAAMYEWDKNYMVRTFQLNNKYIREGSK